MAEFGIGKTTEVEFARLECDEQAGLDDLGLRFAEVRLLTAEIRAELVPA